MSISKRLCFSFFFSFFFGCAMDSSTSPYYSELTLRIGSGIDRAQHLNNLRIYDEDKSVFLSGENIAFFIVVGSLYANNTATLDIVDLDSGKVHPRTLGTVESGGNVTTWTQNFSIKATKPTQIVARLRVGGALREKYFTVNPR